MFASVKMIGMEIIYTLNKLTEKLSQLRRKGLIGFVPTMGALHQGHISLVQRAASENDTVVVSIFVNPTQFNDKRDLERYPRNLEADIMLLSDQGCHVVFAPGVDEVYPEPDNRIFDFGHMDKVMEGKFRPGHFNGVAQVVSRLFDMVKPDRAYFGLKDFQQLAIIQNMVQQLQLAVEIVPCPIVRESNGLAMSSRNELLTKDERENAALIYKMLSISDEWRNTRSLYEVEQSISAGINENPYLETEYVEIVDEDTLEHVTDWHQPGRKVVCVAVWCGKVRLIDNYLIG